jgi:hypothetical protein
VWMKGKGEKRDGRQPTPFMAARWRSREERGRGAVPRGGRERGREGRGPGAVGIAQAAGIGPQPVGAGCAVAARQGRAVGRE